MQTHTVPHLRRWTVLALGASGLLSGCAPTVTIDARNDAILPATLLVERDVAFEDDQVLARVELRPGEWREIGTFEVGLDTVTARVIGRGEEGLPGGRVRLDRGFSRLIIEDAGSEGWTPWTLRVER